MPENYSAWLPRETLLTDVEILTVVHVAADLGFRKFRITGGEPLIRPNIVELVRWIISCPGVESLQMTTNGTRLPLLAEDLVTAGLRHWNVSLDALDPIRYQEITHGSLTPVLEGIELLKKLGCRVKLNTVLMRGKNEDQIEPILEQAQSWDVAVRFIELMPVSMGEMLNDSNFLPAREVQSRLEKIDTLEPLMEPMGFGPARYFRMRKRGIVVGFISAITEEHFCERCNKMRLTADGKLRPCLGNHLEEDLLPALRPAPNSQALRELFYKTLAIKPAEHVFLDNYQPGRIMTAIGG